MLNSKLIQSYISRKLFTVCTSSYQRESSISCSFTLLVILKQVIMKYTLGMVLVCVALTLTLSNVAEACLGNNEACEPDGSRGICCSGYCYKQVGWSSGICVNRKKRDACLGNGLPCKSDGSRGICCSKFCLQQPGQEWGNCR